ncbi:class I SAM-dependent methyltransferase [Spiractinospora alimapuensis]|uniref:O-methyltransferase n=1 Tax=Spiractinospora alimapuensis TaxID=2820884 RepID=UPI001F286BCF|nr:class I SAM-dependent methyltransferase [Spiractinospora alimapuensis]QVQ52480.1 class I SAM-dependent methyltransferase [Spiractinospora alimapuensis]
MADQIDAHPRLLEYVRNISLREDGILRELREETMALPGGTVMQVMAEEGQLLEFLVRLTGARRVLEVGTFTGYSTLCMARALPDDGILVTCDITQRWPEVGAPYWARAGVSDRIDQRIGEAAKTLGELAEEFGPESFDLVFIDADKTNYGNYYEHALTLTRPGALIVIDNTLFFGRVADESVDDPDTVAIRDLNAALRDDARVDLSLLVMADGITLARKRP